MTKVAQFKNTKYQFITVSDDALENSTEYLRITDYEEVHFKPRAYDDRVMDEVGKIDSAINQIMVAAGNEVAELNRRKQELLALTVQQ